MTTDIPTDVAPASVPLLDPRVQRTRQRVLEAADSLLLEGGPRAVTVDAVVARSGVAKTTVYRHWPSHQDLLVDLYSNIAPVIEAPDPALSPVDSLFAVCRAMAVALEDERWQRLLPSLLLTKLELGTIAELKERIEAQHVSVVAEAVRRVADAGLITVDSIEDHVQLLIGPLLTRSLMQDSSTATESPLADFAERVAAHYLRGAAGE